MKQEKNIETKAQRQNGQSIQDALTEMYRTLNWMACKFATPPFIHITSRGISIGGLRVGYGREGPPGRARSPGTGISPFRDHPPWQLLPEFIEGKGG